MGLQAGDTATRPMRESIDGVVFPLLAELSEAQRVDLEICLPSGAARGRAAKEPGGAEQVAAAAALRVRKGIVNHSFRSLIRQFQVVAN